MKYLTIFAFALLVFSCGNPTEDNSNGKTTEASAKNGIAENAKSNKSTGEEMTEQGEGLLRGTFIYVADSAVFTECGTNEKYPVAGDAYLAMEKEYLKKRTRDFQEIYVELKGEIKPMAGMEEGDVKTLSVDELVIMDTEKSCN